MTAAPLKILVIDDEPPIRKLLRMGLTTQGYQTLEAPTGKAGLELLNQKPDLVILDLGLPDIQGHELLRMIRSRNESVPIVVLSSRGDEAGKECGPRFVTSRSAWDFAFFQCARLRQFGLTFGEPSFGGLLPVECLGLAMGMRPFRLIRICAT